MGHGTWGIREYTTTRDKLHGLLPEQIEEVEAIDPAIWHILARACEVHCDPLHTTEDDIADLMKDMCWIAEDYDLVEADCYQAFKKLTNLCHDFNLTTGLVLSLMYYDEDMGDRYDDVEHTNGCVFVLDNVTMLTPEARKVKHLFNLESWTCSG